MTHPWNQPYDGFAVPAEWNLSDEEAEYVLSSTWSSVLTGEDDIDILIENLEDVLDDEADGPVTEDQAAAFMADVLARRRIQQRELGGLPESALTLAFDQLASVGVVARENFTCCGTCLGAEIGDERDGSRPWRGYIAYHTQDAERLCEDRETYVSYGVFLDAFLTQAEWEALSEAERERTYDRLTTELMEREVFPILESHGVAVDWNRDLGTRIKLGNVDYFAAVPES